MKKTPKLPNSIDVESMICHSLIKQAYGTIDGRGFFLAFYPCTRTWEMSIGDNAMTGPEWQCREVVSEDECLSITPADMNDVIQRMANRFAVERACDAET